MTDDSTTAGSENGAPRGIQSIEIGFRLVQCLVKAPHPLSLKTLAERAGVSASRARFYLVSFIRLGLVSQDREHGHYELGPYARHLGLAAIQRMDVVRVSAQPLRRLCDTLKEAVFLAVWGNRGPTIVLTLDGPREIPMSVRVGYVMPVLYTATGRVFLSYLPRQATDTLIKAELAAALRERGRDAANEMAESIESVVQNCRSAGFACTESLLNPGFAGVAAPVFDHRGWLAAVVTVIGLGDQLDVRPNGPNVLMLLRAAEEISKSLGFRGQGANETPAMSESTVL
ncbi:MAG TPA: IclR family transcriptional regulator [Hyphomicrobiaceae bacterium]